MKSVVLLAGLFLFSCLEKSEFRTDRGIKVTYPASLLPGSRTILYVPGPLAFGNNPLSKQVPHNTILIFDLELPK